ncbi:M67 family metallopeptidase [Saccharopolyspora sp. NPDC050389]|uniref:M67 family metallopeptidase n=1 Tax=Saccharopolyspora sp. NPDC050389 TaxID=3155516 RepID=UPI0034057B4C
MFRLRSDLVESIVAHAHRDYPREVCGQLLGPEGASPERYAPMANADDPAVQTYSWRFDPTEQLEVHRQALARGEVSLAVVHSHSRVPLRPMTDSGLPEAYPSPKDIEFMALQPDVRFVIVALKGRDDTEPEVRSFYLDETGEVVEDELRVE